MSRARAVIVALLALLVLGLQAPGPARAEDGVTVLLDERFEEARPLPVIPRYEALSPALRDQLEQAGRWHLILHGSVGRGEVVDGAVSLLLVETGVLWYGIQLSYLPVPIRPSTEYRVTFRARADRPVLTTFDLCTVGKGWHSFSGHPTRELGPEWQRFEVRFRTGKREADPAARLELNFGDVDPTLVQVDDLRVEERAPEEGR